MHSTHTVFVTCYSSHTFVCDQLCELPAKLCCPMWKCDCKKPWQRTIPEQKCQRLMFSPDLKLYTTQLYYSMGMLHCFLKPHLCLLQSYYRRWCSIICWYLGRVLLSITANVCAHSVNCKLMSYIYLFPNAARLGGCLVQEGSSNSVGTPSSYSSTYNPTTYSCVTDCTGGQYEVHVIGMYDAAQFQDRVNVQMAVCGNSSKLLVLVLISQRELQWVVDVPRGVFIHRILVVSP